VHHNVILRQKCTKNARLYVYLSIIDSSPLIPVAAVAGGTTTAGIANLTDLMCTQTQSKGWMLWTGTYANSTSSTTFTTNKNSYANCIIHCYYLQNDKTSKPI
jgi:hypothetical protein